MDRLAPPRWLERMLWLVLPERSRETVSGDLDEEYREQVSKRGKLRASLWYARQVLSFTPGNALQQPAQSPVLACLCVFTTLSATWLGTVGLLLRRPAYIEGEIIAAMIIGQGVLTLGAFYLRVLRPISLAGTLAMLWLAGKALHGLLTGAHFEGYVLLIALALVIQSVFTWIAGLRYRKSAHSQRQ